MKANKKNVLLLIALALTFLSPGCTIPQAPVEVVLPPDPAEELQRGSISNRFQQPAMEAPTAVESAIELSEKYAKLAEEKAALQQQNQDLITENRRLKTQLASLETQLQQTQKELAEANDLLVEMRLNLNNWKFNVLGFRDEMRDAEKVQLEALFKILKILGGEVETESDQNEPADSNPATRQIPNQQQQTPTSGEQND